MGGAIANLKPHGQAQLALRLLANVNHVVCSRNINGHGFLAVNMFTGINDSFKVMWMEIRRGGNQNEINLLRSDNVPIGIRAFEELRGVDGRISLRLLHVVEMLAPFFQLVGK